MATTIADNSSNSAADKKENEEINASAYVLINSDLDKEQDVLKSLNQYKKESGGFITEIYGPLLGVYDIIIKIYGKDFVELKGMILTKIRKIEYVRSTLTLMVED